jgi:hypothetical protein
MTARQDPAISGRRNRFRRCRRNRSANRSASARNNVDPDDRVHCPGVWATKWPQTHAPRCLPIGPRALLFYVAVAAAAITVTVWAPPRGQGQGGYRVAGTWAHRGHGRRRCQRRAGAGRGGARRCPAQGLRSAVASADLRRDAGHHPPSAHWHARAVVYLAGRAQANLTHTVHSNREYLPAEFPLVHPLPLNYRWHPTTPGSQPRLYLSWRASCRSSWGTDEHRRRRGQPGLPAVLSGL